MNIQLPPHLDLFLEGTSYELIQDKETVLLAILHYVNNLDKGHKKKMYDLLSSVREVKEIVR